MTKFIMENRVNSGDTRTAGNPEPSRNSKVFTPKACKVCGKTFQPYAPCNLYCPECIPVKIAIKKQKQREGQMRRQLKQGRPVGCGRGGNTKKGKEDSSYKYGYSFFRRTSKQMKEEVRYCERCGKDLLNADRYHWCVHHIDHNRYNNVRENYMLLCKRSHQLEHNCIKALPQYSGRRNDHPERE